MGEVVLKRYSVAFKHHIVREYERGKSVTELRRRYGIKGAQTVQRWIERYGTEGLRHKVMTIQKPEESDRVKVLEGRVQELESALAQASLDRVMYETLLDVSREKYGLDLKKKIDVKLLKEHMDRNAGMG